MLCGLLLLSLFLALALALALVLACDLRGRAKTMACSDFISSPRSSFYQPSIDSPSRPPLLFSHARARLLPPPRSLVARLHSLAHAVSVPVPAHHYLRPYHLHSHSHSHQPTLLVFVLVLVRWCLCAHVLVLVTRFGDNLMDYCLPAATAVSSSNSSSRRRRMICWQSCCARCRCSSADWRSARRLQPLVAVGLIHRDGLLRCTW